MSKPIYWLVTFLSCVVALLPRLVYRVAQTMLCPDEVTRALVSHKRAASRAPFFGYIDLLTTRELELGTTQGLNDCSLEPITTANTHDWLTNVHTSYSSLGFTKSTSHTSLETRIEKFNKWQRHGI
ncbi:unnamed protein product, partial [Callosobruchus maculatus]